MLAALRLGARQVVGFDVDPISVEAARTLLARQAPDASWEVDTVDIFDITPETHGLHEVVYSWGVLHHTGDVWGALDRASRLVAPRGFLVFALYRRTPFCRMWEAEKRFYSRAHPAIQAAMRGIYKAAFIARIAAGGQNPVRYVHDYCSQRGMDWGHDVHDWLGGYPYESVHPSEVRSFLSARGFQIIRANEQSTIGLFGSGCNEWVAARSGTPA
jgi:SAM-dependent methyltransferase